MTTKVLKSIKGRVVRITRLDTCGAPVFGEGNVVVTSGFITLTVGQEIVTGAEYEQANAWGEPCVQDKDPDYAKWANVTLSMCEVHPDVLDIIGGALPVVVGDDTIGSTFGPGINTGAFAVEVWTKKVNQDSCVDGTPEWGYMVVPYVKNGRLDGDIPIGASVLNMDLVGQGFGAPSAWGIGPHMDNPFRASSGFPVGEHFGLVTTNVQPPAETDGVGELFGPISATQPGDVYPAGGFPTIVAQDATNAGRLAALGFIALPVTAWASGEFFAIGAFHFNWSGSAWAAGAHA